MRNKNLFGKYCRDHQQGDVTNSLTQAVMKFIRHHGGAAFRVNTSGIPIMTNGGITWRRSTNPGAADVRAIINGKSIDIEVKSDTDKLNDNQIKFKHQVLSAKGEYWEIRSFDDFQNYWNNFIKTNHSMYF